MTILVTGATGTIGRVVVEQLVARGASVRAYVRDPARAQLPAGVALAKGDMLDIDGFRAALSGVSTLFLLTAVAADEVTQSLTALNLAREAGIERIVYLSVIHGALYADVPHFAGKAVVERMIEATDMAATILQPAYFMNNDAAIRDVVTNYGVYPMPLGDKGIAMVDARDVGEVAALELLRRNRAPGPLPRLRIPLVGPDTLTGTEAAAVWSAALNREIAYGGEDGAGFEQTLRATMPAWMAFDMRMMAARFAAHGMIPEAGDRARLTAMLGRPLHDYRTFVAGLTAA
ncbi:SDR family oxidoreductase [Sphingomonas morindae]|uniref:NmrA family NAD(P)-binding protein n=1 Tax=Sphingomonas morindae TaxID=1541170 RepID=A0ABY4XDC4_9SPHN|nr:NmrA family NAD(P)-binding protein [Sphingomonas morindae]USI74980.1 NmrA family NAD(P)-binding protein [Sphingomonas morindae]